MLEARGIVKAFGGHRAVDGVSFTLQRGRITGLIGPNGAGKTTLFNLVAGTMRPTEGTLTLEDARIDGLRPDEVFARGLGRTFQIPRPFPAMTVLENVMLAPRAQQGERFWANWLRPGAVARGGARNRSGAMHLARVRRCPAWPRRPAPGCSRRAAQAAGARARCLVRSHG
jgi:branched-chain amino acid transport system ATP-binding protein